MARTKGSKNKATKKTVAFDDQIAAEKAEKEKLELVKAEITAAIAESTNRLKETNKQLRAIDRRIAKLEAQKAEADLAAASAAKRIEIQEAITALLDGGMAEDEILEKLKK